MFSPSPCVEVLYPVLGLEVWLLGSDKIVSTRQVEWLVLTVSTLMDALERTRTSSFLVSVHCGGGVSVCLERSPSLWFFPLCSVAAVRCPALLSWACALICFSPGPEEWSASYGLQPLKAEPKQTSLWFVFLRCFHKDAELTKTLGICRTFLDLWIYSCYCVCVLGWLFFKSLSLPSPSEYAC